MEGPKSREEKIEARLTNLRRMGKDYSAAKAEVTYLEEFKKSKLAILMKLAESKGVTSAAGQERDARADGAYLEMLLGLRVAVEKAEALRWELTVAQMGAEVWRTNQATRRIEMQMYGPDAKPKWSDDD